MVDALLVLVAVLVAWVALVAGATWILLRRAARANRVTPGVPSPVPIWWRWSPSPSALLHRRLQAAAYGVDPARPSTGLVSAVGTDELRGDAVAAALRTDAELAALRAAPGRVRRAERGRLAHRVATIEDLCARLREQPAPTAPVRTLVARPPASPEDDLVALQERMRHLEAGRAEVRRWTGDRSSVA